MAMLPDTFSNVPSADTLPNTATKTWKGIEPRIEESEEDRIERLGRERPPHFASAWHEIGFCFALVMSQVLAEYFLSGFTLLLPTLIKDLNISSASSVWPATAFSLVIASTLTIFGRLGDQHGGYLVYVFGATWLAVWSVIVGFSVNPLMLDLCRALQGIGCAALLPTGVMLLGSAYRPGPRKNVVFSIYGTCSVVGFFLGIFCSGLIAQLARWSWFFWIGAVLSVITLVATIFCVPNDRQERKKHHIESDWWGAATIVVGLVLIVFAITESAHTSWRVAYIPVTFTIGVISLATAVYIEGWVAARPLLPADVFLTKGMTPLLLSIFLLYGTVAIFLLYGAQYFQGYMGASPLQVVAWFVPMAAGGMILAVGEGMLLHIIPGYYLLILSGIGALGAQLLLGLIPFGGNYWAWLFPAMILATIGIDLSITLMMIFVTTRLPLARQGLGGGLVNSVLQLGVAVCIGFSDIIRSQTSEYQGERQGLKNTFWFGVALSATSLILMSIWGQIPRQTSELTADEKLQLQLEASKELSHQK